MTSTLTFEMKQQVIN